MRTFTKGTFFSIKWKPFLYICGWQIHTYMNYISDVIRLIQTWLLISEYAQHCKLKMEQPSPISNQYNKNLSYPWPIENLYIWVTVASLCALFCAVLVHVIFWAYLFIFVEENYIVCTLCDSFCQIWDIKWHPVIQHSQCSWHFHCQVQNGFALESEIQPSLPQLEHSTHMRL